MKLHLLLLMVDQFLQGGWQKGHCVLQELVAVSPIEVDLLATIGFWRLHMRDERLCHSPLHSFLKFSFLSAIIAHVSQPLTPGKSQAFGQLFFSLQKPTIIENSEGSVKDLRWRKGRIAYGSKEQFQLPLLHAGLAKELKSNTSQLSKTIEHYHFSTSKIPNNKFASFKKGSKKGRGSRLRLLYYHIVVKNNWNLLAAVFRMSEIPFPETDAKTPFKRIGRKEAFFLQYQPKNIEFETAKVNLDLRPWTKASHSRYSRGIPVELYERFMKACKANDEVGKEQETEQIEQEELVSEYDLLLGDSGLEDLVTQYLNEQNNKTIDWKKEWDDFFYPHFVDGNFNPKENLKKQHRLPTVAATIERKNACWRPFRQYHADCAAHYSTKFRLNQYTWDGETKFFVRRKDPDSLFGSLRIKNYAQYVCTVLNNAWIFFSEECASLHHTQVVNRGPIKGLGGHGNGYHRLGAAYIIVYWDDDEKLERLRNDFPDLLCIRPFKTTEEAKNFLSRWEGNYIIPENEIIKKKKVDKNSLKDHPGFDPEPGKQMEYKSIKETWEFIHRDKNPERANQLWTKVVKKNHALQHKYFSKSECDMAASYILKWLHRPRI